MSEHEIPVKSLSLWERAKVAVKGFVSHAVGYVPRGVVLTGAIFAGSAVIETMLGATPDAPRLLGIATTSTSMLITKFATHMAFGSLVSGVMGATSDVVCACKDPHKYAMASAAGLPMSKLKEQSSPAQDISHSLTESGITTTMDHVVHHGLPYIAKGASHTLGG